MAYGHAGVSVIYWLDNDHLVNSAGEMMCRSTVTLLVLLSLGATIGSAQGTDSTQLLYAQTDLQFPYHLPPSYINATAYWGQVADDFIAPSDWELQKIVIIGDVSITKERDRFDIYILEDDEGHIGPLVYSAAGQPYESEYLPAFYTARHTITLDTAAVLRPGHYWMSVQYHAYGNAVFEWAMIYGYFGRTALFRRDGGTCATWNPIDYCLGPDPGQTNMYFELLGRDVTTRVDERPPVPSAYSLSQNFPNPFNPSTTIEYFIPNDVGTLHTTSLHVVDLLGRRVATLIDGPVAPGTHSVVFDASGFSSGVYLYRLQSGAFVETRMMTLMK